MNTEKFRILTESMEAIPNELRSHHIEGMAAIQGMANGRAADFAYVVDIAASYIPELITRYDPDGFGYRHDQFRIALNEFLECDFVQWARDYAGVWENESGYLMFDSNEAFGKDDNEKLTVDDIIFHIRKAYDNWVELTEKD